MDIRRKRILIRVADVVISLVAVFLLLDAALGFTGRQHASSAQSQSQSASQDLSSPRLSTSCTGGFSNQRTVNGVTQIAPSGMPFNAYRITLTNTGGTAITVHSVNVELVDSQHRVFAQHEADLGNGAGITLNLGESRQIVEAYGISHPVASCEILSWQS